MSDETVSGLSEEEVFSNDIDPVDAIAEIRRNENKDAQEDSASEEVENTASDLPSETEDDKKELEEEDTTAAEDGSKDGEENPGTVSKEDDKSVVDTDEDEDGETSNEQDSAPINLSETRKFKAKGKEYEFTVEEMLEQFGTVFGQAVDYTQKTQKVAPYRKMISAIEEQGITQDQLNMAIDALKGDKGAIKKMMENHKLEAYDLSQDTEGESYTPGDYGSDDLTLQITDIVEAISGDPEYQITSGVIQTQWDDGSRKQFADNPNLITALHNDVKSGTFDKVAPLAAKMKILDGNTKSDIEYYMLAGQEFSQRQAAETAKQKADELNSETQRKVASAEKASSEAEKKRSAGSTGSRSDRTVTDYLDDNDEAFDEWYKKTISSV